MTRTTTAFTALALAAACAACAPVEQPPETIAGLSTDRQCFFTRQIDGYGDAPDGRRGDRIYISTGLDDRWPFVSSLCTGDTATLIVPRGLDRTPDRCTVRLLGKMAETS